MERAYKNSLIGRILAWLRKYYAKSAIKRSFTRTSLFYSQSRIGGSLLRRLGAPSVGLGSNYYALLTKLNKSLRNLGQRLRPTFGDSFFGRFSGYADRTEMLSVRLYRRLTINRIFLLLFALYMPLDVLLRNFEAIGTIWDEAFFLLCVLFLIYDVTSSREMQKPRVTPIDSALLLFVALGLLLMFLVPSDLRVAVDGYRAVCQSLLWFFVIVRLIKSDEDGMALVYAMVIIGALVALHGVYQFVAAVPIPVAWVSDTEMGVRTRVFSILGSPNIMGCFMLMLAPLSLSLSYHCRRYWAKLTFLGCAGIMCLACLFTFSRGAWLGLAVGLLLFALLRDRKLIVLMLAVTVVAVFIPDVMNRITYLFTSDFSEASQRAGRAGRWEFGIDLLFRSNPVLGYGLGGFGGAIAMQNQAVEGMTYFYMDNYYLKTMVEMGILGFSGYMLLILGTIWNGFRSLFRVRSTPMYSVCAGLFAGIIGVLTHCFFENIFEVPYMSAYFWGLVGLLLWFGFIRKN